MFFWICAAVMFFYLSGRYSYRGRKIREFEAIFKTAPLDFSATDPRTPEIQRIVSLKITELTAKGDPEELFQACIVAKYWGYK